MELSLANYVPGSALFDPVQRVRVAHGKTAAVRLKQ